MNDSANLDPPFVTRSILEDTQTLGFDMLSDPLTCSLLRTLATTKASASFLELGSGTGFSTAWLLAGMDATSTLISLDNDPELLNIAKKHLGHDPRVTFLCQDGDSYVQNLPKAQFDFIFADTWPGKYRYLKNALAALKPAGFYIVDDMLPQENWPKGHGGDVANLTESLDSLDGFHVTKLSWASGLIIVSKPRY